MDSRRIWMWVALLLVFAVSFLGGAEAHNADLRRAGYEVPHIWQTLTPNPCKTDR